MSAAEAASGTSGRSGPAGTRGAFLWWSVALFALVTASVFWRYFFSAATTVSDPGDPLLLIWIMEWVERTLVHSPVDLFAAPMFHPFPDTLAYSDPLIPESVLGLPLRLVGFGPILSYNLIFLGGIVATGVLFSLLFLELTGDPAAALLGALVATLPSARLYHLAHLQLQFTPLWPVTLLLVHRVVQRADTWSTAALTVALAAVPLASLYYGMFLALLMPPFALTLWLTTRRRSRRALPALAAAAVAAGLLLLPIGRVYRRAISHVALNRDSRDFADLSHYLSISEFSDLGRLFPSLVVRDASPQWVGGFGAWILVPAALLLVVVAWDGWRVTRSVHLPPRARTALPYMVLGILALLLSLGPEVRFHGQPLFENPIGKIARLPGIREIRDFQRVGFVVAFAAGAILALGISELRRLGKARMRAALTAFVAVSTVVPTLSSALPAYRPPPREALSPAYASLAELPEPVVLYETPLPPRGLSDHLDYLWAAVHHQKRLVHGFSGYLPLTDDTLRGEASSSYRADYFRTLAALGATHLLVHTKELAMLPGGEAALLELRDARSAERVIAFQDAEIYRVPRLHGAEDPLPRTTPIRRRMASGGWVDPEDPCVEILPKSPLVLFSPESAESTGLRFVAQSPIGEMDDALLVERSDDLRHWRPALHRPLLSTSLAAYVAQPSSTLVTRVVLQSDSAPFTRLSTARDQRLRLCDLWIDSSRIARVEPVSSGRLHVNAHANSGLLPALLDGDAHTRWDSGAVQRGAEWIEIDLGDPRAIVAIVLDLGDTPYDYGRTYSIGCTEPPDMEPRTVDLDGRDATFQRPRPVQVLPFAARNACRRVRVSQTGSASSNFWSVSDISVLAREP